MSLLITSPASAASRCVLTITKTPILRSSPEPLPSRAHLPNLGSAVAPVSPSTPYFPGRSEDDLEHGGLSLKMTNDGEKDGSLGYKPSGIAVRVERSVA